MGQIFDVISKYNSIVLIAMSILIIILFIMVIMAFSSLSKLENRYRKVLRGIDGQSIEDTINSYMNTVEEVKEKSLELNDGYKILNDKVEKCVQKVAIKRYKAFSDVGSDLSFSLALLDEGNDGIILTSIFGRQESTIYAKPIDKGISRYDLSEEEKEALRSAVSNKIIISKEK